MESRYGTEGEISRFGRDDAAQRLGIAVSVEHECDGLSVVDKRYLMEGGCLDSKCAFDRAELCGREAEIAGGVDVESVGTAISCAMSEQDLLASEVINGEAEFITEAGIQILQIPFDETDGAAVEA